MKHQQEISYQLDLFIEQKQNDIHSSDNRKDVNQAKARKVGQVNEEGEPGDHVKKLGDSLKLCFFVFLKDVKYARQNRL